MIKITLKDGSTKEYEKGIKAIDIAKDISEGLARVLIAAEIDGKTEDLNYVLEKDATINFLKFEDKGGKSAYWHTSSHILAQAVKRLYKNVKLAIGPSIDQGFYYDFDVEQNFNQTDIEKIEVEMKKIIKENLEIERFDLPKEEALELMKDEPYKIELINEFDENEPISFYKQGDFVDLCAGPHLRSTGSIKSIRIILLAGAYWRGSEKNKMLSRIYAISFPKASMTEAYIQMLEEAKTRDHNKLGRELELFTTVDIIGQGLPLLMPKGAKIVQILQRYIEDLEESNGYLLTKTPMMAKSDLYKISGHWDHYREGMFIIGGADKNEEELALRPMTCPFQFMIYKSKLRSYRDLPLRYAETSTLFRNESSGEMHGLMRLRQFTISEGHLLVTKEQLADEFKGVIELVNGVMTTLGIEKDIWYRFSKGDLNNKEKFIDNNEAWIDTETKMKEILDEIGMDYEETEGEAAFYGPKLDYQFKNVYGKEDTIITIQIDFSLPDRFKLEYVDKDGEKKRPYVIHRTSIGCYERTLAMLIEKFAGAFPLWMAPEQVRILPIIDKHHDYSEKISKELNKLNIRNSVDYRNEKIGYKIREARLEKIPYIFIIGDKEIENNTVAVRKRGSGDIGAIDFKEFKNTLIKEINEKIM